MRTYKLRNNFVVPLQDLQAEQRQTNQASLGQLQRGQKPNLIAGNRRGDTSGSNTSNKMSGGQQNTAWADESTN